jgi:hypothetical protein
MSSKLILLFVAIAMTSVSCSLPIFEEPPPPRPVEFKASKDTLCLSDALPIFKEFYEGTATEPKLRRIWDCVNTALIVFKSTTRGQEADKYSPRELANFFEQYFLNEVTINDTLLVELMRIKQVFVGGTTDYVTRDELTQSIEIFKTIRDVTIDLAPYMKILTFNWQVGNRGQFEQDVRYFEGANETLQQSVRSIANIINKKNPAYRIENFVRLLDEVTKLYDGSWDIGSKVTAYLPVVYKVKKSLSGGDADSIAASEWNSFLLLGARGYIQFLRYHYFLKGLENGKGAFQITWIVQTVDDLFSFLGDAVASKPTGSLSRAELLDMLQSFSFLWGDKKISDELLFELMKLKQVAFGGSADKWAPTDFQNARMKLNRYRSIIERILPYLTIYGLNWDPYSLPRAESEVMLSQARESLRGSAVLFASTIETSYDLNDLNKLINAFNEFTDSSSSADTWLNDLKKSIPVLVATKGLITSDSSSTIKRREWPYLLEKIAEGYGHYLTVHYFLSREEPTRGAGLELLNRTAIEVFGTLKGIIYARPQQKIEISDISNWATAILKSGIVKTTFSESSVEPTVRGLVGRLFMPAEIRINSGPANALSAIQINYLQTVFQNWYLAQTEINQVLAGKNEISAERVINGFKKFDKAKDPRYEMRWILDTQYPLTTDSLGRLKIFEQKSPSYSATTLYTLNIYRAAALLIMSAYAEDLSRINNYAGVTLQELNLAMADFRPLLIDIGLLSPKNLTFAESRFREANLFTPRADGVSILNFIEGVEIFTMAFSGLAIDTQVAKVLPTSCPFPSTIPKWDQKIDVNCFKQFYLREFPKTFESGPDMLRFVSKLNSDEWSRFSMNILKAAGYVDNRKGELFVMDATLTHFVLQYIEMLFLRYDKNQDGFFNTEEALAAYPVFKGIIKELGGVSKERDVRAVFTYMMRYGKAPNRANPKDILRYLNWRSNESQWDIWASRATIGEILGYIADEIAKAQKKSPQP